MVGGKVGLLPIYRAEHSVSIIGAPWFQVDEYITLFLTLPGSGKIRKLEGI
jgi:hypothetical protein